MKALVLSGGGSKGAYECGVLDYLMGEQGTVYDLFAGVSVGAINAGFLAQFGNGFKSSDAYSKLNGLWNDISKSTVYKNWFPPYISAIWRPSLYDSSPLHTLVKDNVNPVWVTTSGKKLRIGATGLETGEYRIFTESYPNICTAILASSAFPGMLTPVELEGQLWTDGGVKSTTPLRAAIQAGADDIDIILCSPAADPSTGFTSKTTALSVAARAIDLMSDQIEANDLKTCQTEGKVKLRIVRPDSVLVENPLDFSYTLLQQMQAQGHADAKRILG
jgi:NTE family protein